MDFYRDVRYLDYRARDQHVENVGSAKFLCRGNVGKAEIYINKIPCHYPVECKLVITVMEKACYTRWLEIEREHWQKSFEFSCILPYDKVEIELFIEGGGKICKRQESVDFQKQPAVVMQQISSDEIEIVPMREANENLQESAKNHHDANQAMAEDNSENNEYYMSRLSELSELSKELEPLEHNSFLLHGYFNYRHLLIKREGDRFLVGVPGNYYKREEMVAEMFGFPNFISAKKKEQSDNADKIIGEFGYYFGK